MSARAMLQHELKMVRDQRDGLQAALDEAEAECQRLRERLATTDAARQQALADLTAAEMHLDAAGLSIPTLPQPSDSSDNEWAVELEDATTRASRINERSAMDDAHMICHTVDALVREWPARRERLLRGGGDG